MHAQKIFTILFWCFIAFKEEFWLRNYCFTSRMGSKVKGMFKGFNKKLTNIFVVKEPEMEIEIGCPTDVKHVGHIGWDGSAGATSSPSWMGEFKTGPEFASSTIGNTSALPATSDSGESPTEAPKKQRRKKQRKSSSSSISVSSSTSPSTGGASTGSSKKKSKTRLRKGKAKLEDAEEAL